LAVQPKNTHLLFLSLKTACSAREGEEKEIASCTLRVKLGLNRALWKEEHLFGGKTVFVSGNPNAAQEAATTHVAQKCMTAPC
jgi:hypothetical protein